MLGSLVHYFLAFLLAGWLFLGVGWLLGLLVSFLVD
jgi:hypothetical protein